MNSKHNLFLQDIALSVRASFLGEFGRTLAQRATLEKLLEVRRQRFAEGHAAFVDVYADLAQTYVGYAADDLATADQLAQEALRILLLTSKLGKNTFRAGKLIHLRSQIQQRLNHQIVALELGEEALAIYNNTRLISYQRASLMHTLIHLHNQVGLADRAQRLAIEVKTLDHVLSSRSSRHRF